MNSTAVAIVVFILGGLSVTQERPTESKDRAEALLQSASAESAAFASAMRAYLLWQVGNAWISRDRAKAIHNLQEAFKATTSIEDDPETKSFLQQQALTLIFRLDPAKAEEISSRAEPGPRQITLDRLIRHHTQQKNFARAIELTRTVVAEREFPYAAASQLMQTIPPSLAAERTSLFALALNSYRAHEHKFSFQTEDLGALTVRFWRSLPKDLVIEAIDELFRQAKADSAADNAVRATMHSSKGTVSFGSPYEYRLFQLLPVLRQLDPARAAALLKQQAGVRRFLADYPEGVDGLDAEYSSGQPSSGVSVTLRVEGKAPDAGSQMDRYFVELERERDGIVKKILATPTQARALLASLPDGAGMKNRSFRAEALLDAVEHLAETESDAAASLLSELEKSLPGLEPLAQVKYLARASALALKVGAIDRAKDHIRQGMTAARRLLETDQKADDPNRSLKAFWPSTAASRVFVALGAKVSPEFAAELTEDVQDEEIRATLNVTLAARLLGAPDTVNMAMRKQKTAVLVEQLPIPQ